MTGSKFPVLVHVGSAISIVDEAEAKTTMDILMQMGDINELDGAGKPS